MTLGGGCDVDDIGLARFEKRFNVSEVMFDSETLSQLPGHKLLSIADAHDLAVRDPQNLAHVFIGDFSAADNTNLDHSLTFSSFLTERIERRSRTE